MDYIKFVQDIEDRINSEAEDRLYSDWVKFADGNWEEEYFEPKRPAAPPSKVEWPDININDALQDDDLMLIDQLSKCNSMLNSQNGKLFHMRSNYGVGILPSLYGVERFIMPYETNTLPNVYPIAGGIDGIKKAIDNGTPDLNNGWGEKVFKFGEKMLEIKSKYPKIDKYIRVDHPDCQGPMDVCELLWGSEIFYEMYDRPELVHKLLRSVTDTYKAFLGKWFEFMPGTDNYHAYFGSLHKGLITVRDDSAMNLSGEMFDEFIFAYDQELYQHFGGGAMHYCGRGDHFISSACRIDGLNAVNLSQPHLNNMKTVLESAVNNKVCIFALSKEAINDAINQKIPLNGLINADS